MHTCKHFIEDMLGVREVHYLCPGAALTLVGLMELPRVCVECTFLGRDGFSKVISNIAPRGQTLGRPQQVYKQVVVKPVRVNREGLALVTT